MTELLGNWEEEPCFGVLEAMDKPTALGFFRHKECKVANKYELFLEIKN